MLSPEENEFLTRTGPGTPMGELFRRFWLPVLLAEELPTPDCPPVRVQVLGERLVAFRDTQGRIGLLDTSCAHRRADLFFGRNEECGLRCVYHGWKYDIEGNCVDMPSEPPESQFKEKIHLTAYPCREQGGVIWAYLGPKELLPDFPAIEWAFVPESHRYVSKCLVESNYLQALEGDIDHSHVAFLHSWLDPRTGQRAGIGAPGRNPRSYEELYTPLRFAVKDADYGLLIGAGRDRKEGTTQWHITEWLMPAYLFSGGYPRRPHLCNVRVPINDENSWMFRVYWAPDRPLTAQEIETSRSWNHPQLVPGTFRLRANKENDFLIDRELQRSTLFSGIRGQVEQDRAVTVSMGPIVDRSKERLGTTDRAIIAMRRKLRKVALDLQEGIEPYSARHGEVYRVRPVDMELPQDTPFDEGAKGLLHAPVGPSWTTTLR